MLQLLVASEDNFLVVFVECQPFEVLVPFKIKLSNCILVLLRV